MGHRWLAFLKFKDANGASSNALLGRDQAHWSFFFNSDASVMEGNKIDDLGGGAFKDLDAVKRYSALDRYAMGLLSKSQVPDFFYVESPTNVSPERRCHQRAANRRNVQRHAARPVDRRRGCGDGRAEPDPGDQPKVHRQAFIYMLSAGATVNQTQVAKMDTIRKAWVASSNRRPATA